MLRAVVIVFALLVSCIASGCMLGSERSPGCRADHAQDCESGWSCRDGVCFRPTTAMSSADAQPEAEASDDASAD
jgi:hypothetical protein